METTDGDADNTNWSIFSITDNLSKSLTVTSDLSRYIQQNQNDNQNPVGMSNFKSKRQLSADAVGINGRININGARERWQQAIRKTKLMNDPWTQFHIEDYKPENCLRHRYNAIKKKWIVDKCTVKMECNSFACGAMRECYRLKKLSNFSHKQSWDHAANYVAKAYKDKTIPLERYYDEVKLQMDAKLWAEAYNRHNPPKKVDMFQMCILEFNERPDSPLFHLEHYIEGNYIKYNSNSGFVDDASMRNTPQAFSHFTFECSNHELIVVDIQGVGDLWTDPQIHTVKGVEYGDGNLGIKGMALFFHSHVCNSICLSLGLTQFDLTAGELQETEKPKQIISALTVCRGHEEICIGSPTGLGEYFRNRFQCKSQTSIGSDETTSMADGIDESEGYESESSPVPISPNAAHKSSSAISFPIKPPTGRLRTQSSVLDSAFSPDDAIGYFNQSQFNNPRPSCVHAECATIEEENSDSVLGLIHLELCKYHELGRFIIDEHDENIDTDAAFYHLRQAAKLNVLEALLNISKIYLNLPRDILSSFNLQECDENQNIAFDFIYQAAEKCDKNSILYIAKAYDTGHGLHSREKPNWQTSIDWYKKLIVNSPDDEQQPDMGFSETHHSSHIDEPIYAIIARMAEMFETGGYGLTKNLAEARDLYNEAADMAMSCGKGRVANKYYMLVEKISAEID